MFLIKITFICIIFFSSPSVSSALFGECDPSEIKEELIQLGLDPEITINEEFIDALEREYGAEIVHYLTEKHPFLEISPLSKIDPETLHWTINAIWSSESNVARYLLMTFDFNDMKAIKQYTSFAFQALYQFNRKTILVFINLEDSITFNLHAEKLLKEQILEKVQNISDKELDTMLFQFKKHYLSASGKIVGLNSIKHDNPILIIVGHGAAGKDHIKIGKSKISHIDLVKNLKLLKIPKNSTIRLNSCFSGCTTNKLNIDVSQIKTLFKQGILNAHFGPVTGSFLDSFAKTIYTEIYDFTGKVEGYIGRVNTLPQESVLKKDGTLMPKGNAVSITGTDGSVLLKKEETMVSISRSDIS